MIHDDDFREQMMNQVEIEEISPESNQLAHRVIGASIEVHRELGAGFEERTYQRALAIELDACGIPYETEVPVQLMYKGHIIGDGRIDMLIHGKLIVELKAADPNPKRYRRQVAAYLKATGYELGLVINFEVDVLKDGISRVANSSTKQPTNA